MIRPVEEKDVPVVVELVRTTLAEFGIGFGEGADTDAALLDLPRSYTGAGGAFFVAVSDGAIVGTAGVIPVEPGSFELRKMYLARAARGRGTGYALFAACRAFVERAGARRIVLDTTEEMKAAIAFYERLGFVRDDTQRRASRCSRGYRMEL